MIGMLSEYEPVPMLYCNEKGFHCNAYRDDPCDECPYDTSHTKNEVNEE